MLMSTLLSPRISYQHQKMKIMKPKPTNMLSFGASQEISTWFFVCESACVYLSEKACVCALVELNQQRTDILPLEVQTTKDYRDGLVIMQQIKKLTSHRSSIILYWLM